MKAFAIIMLAAAMLGGAVSINLRRENDSVIIETRVDNAQEIADNTKKIVSAAEDAFLQAAADASANHTAEAAPDTTIYYRIRNAENEAASQIGAYLDLETAISMCPAGYCIFDTNANLIYQS